MKDHHLAEHLGLAVTQRPLLRQVLRDMARDGEAAKIKGNRWAPPAPKAEHLTGTLSVSFQGHGMVRFPGVTGVRSEAFIPPDALGGAMHGDEVEVELVAMPASRRSGQREEASTGTRIKRPEGRIIRVLSRRKNVLVGLLMKSDSYWYVIPDHPRIRQNVKVQKARSLRSDPPAGHKVVVRLDPDSASGMLHGEIIEVLGDPDAPGVDVLSILREHEIATGFSAHTEEEVRGKSAHPRPEDAAGRLDLRSEMILVIDPADAKDHDDAVSLRRRPEGGWILGVHIADVSHFVTPGAPVDRDAREHGNSVYMVDRFIPMLPPYLTSEICSLKAGRDRLAYSVFISYDGHANVVDVEMGPTIIHPAILLDYESVQSLIAEGAGEKIPAHYHEVLRDMHDLATRLRNRRMHHGAIDLAMPEVNCILDETGRPLSMKRRTSAEAYHLIEEFMLAANVAVAERLVASHVPAIYRIHEDPAEDQWQQMALDLQQLGIQEEPVDRHDLQRIARQFAKHPLAYPVSISILRNLKRAVYSADCVPHFGLAFDKYTHFTSPIRRYSDLVVHRILKGLDQRRGGVYSRAECEEVAMHCSRREREASEAEEESLIIKRIQYYAELLSKGETGPWPALITGGTSRGLLVEIVETLQRGFIPSHALPDPDVRLDRETGRISGRKGRKMARIGDVIPVELMRVDNNRRSVELRWVESSAPAQPAHHAEASRRRPGSKRRQRNK